MEEKNVIKPVIWLAGDSTMQSYSEEKRPQWGWGEKLLELLEDIGCKEATEKQQLQGLEKDMGNVNTPGDGMIQIKSAHRQDCPFDQEKRYEGPHFIVDNCAMAGRSSKTFREEGRLQDIEGHIQPGDYLLIQFGHNDAGAAKPERYVPLELFKESLAHYVNVALHRGATPILLSSIVLCPGEQTDSGEAGAIKRLLPEYGKVMEAYARELQIPYIDMNKLTGDYIKDMSREQAEELYLPDHVHLVEKGAYAYARLFTATWSSH